MSLVRSVKQTIIESQLLAPGELVLVGVSGGPDSLCLLHVLRQLADELSIRLHAAHLHHGIRGQDADEEAAFVADTCQKWQIDCTVERADVPAVALQRGIALEEAARQVRYTFLGRLARSLGSRSVAVPHNADDQVETILMHLLRGSGLAGLRGMRPCVWLDEMRLGTGDGPTTPPPESRIRLLRPLLAVPRADIESYCATHNLQPRVDRSNLDITYFRNRLRHELLPLLQSYNPNIREGLLRTAEVMTGDYELLRDLLERTWPQVVREESEALIALDIKGFRALPVGLQRSLLREAIHRLRFSLRNIGWVHVNDAVAVMLRGNVGSQATLPGGLMLTLGYERAWIAPARQTLPLPDWPGVEQPVPLPQEGTITLADGRWQVSLRITPSDALDDHWQSNRDHLSAYLDADKLLPPLLLRPQRPHDWFMPLGLGHRKSVREFMIGCKVPRPLRPSVPLLTNGEHIAWVVGWRIDARFAVEPTTSRIVAIRVHRVGDEAQDNQEIG